MSGATPRTLCRRLLPVPTLAGLLLLASCGTESTTNPPNTAPTAAFTVTPVLGSTSTVFQVDASGATDAEDAATALQVRWDWDSDGAWDTDYSITKTGSHQYGTTGAKTIKLEVRDSRGLLAGTTHEVTVSTANTAPIAAFTVNPLAGTPLTTFQVEAWESTDAEDALATLQVRWDWESDGTWDTAYATRKTASHQFEEEGRKTISLEVKDSGGLLGSTTRTATVLPGSDTMVLVPAGSLMMGSPAEELGRDSDETQHLVTLTRPFYISVHEVTVTEWRVVMDLNEFRFTGDLDHPVVNVTWFDAIDFCNRKSRSRGFTPVYTITSPVRSADHITSATVSWNQDADGYRLPTEAEWEHASRAGTQTAFASGGISNTGCSPLDANLDQMGWYCSNSGGTTHAVKEKSANGLGLYDMHGNVWEWCWDRYGLYAPPYTDPTGAASGSDRVFRGGSWGSIARYCRSAVRDGSIPGDRSSGGGLRLAMTAF